MDPTTANNSHETDQLQGEKKGNKKEKQTWGQFFYNRKNGKVFNRSIGSWFQLLIFYVVFYALLAAFWAVMLAVFLQTLDDKYPKWYGPQSVMSTDHGSGWGPGVSFQPQPSSDSTLISLGRPSSAPARSKRDVKPVEQSGSPPPDIAAPYVTKMKEFLAKYMQPNPNRRDCATKMLDGTSACAFNPTQSFGSDCSEADGFGYNVNQPCVVVAVNRIYGWTPQPYNSSVHGQEMPAELQSYLNKLPGRPAYNPKRVYFICDGEDPVDQEHIGEVRMFPADGIDAEKYFPYQHQKGYVSPLVAARFMNVTRDLVVNVVCRAFAGNVPFSSDDRLGATKFEILIRGGANNQAR